MYSFHIRIISTSKGIMSDQAAVKANLGGKFFALVLSIKWFSLIMNIVKQIQVHPLVQVNLKNNLLFFQGPLDLYK